MVKKNRRKQVGFAVTEEELKKLKECAENRGMTLSSHLRNKTLYDGK